MKRRKFKLTFKQQLKREAYAILGNKCQSCGFDNRLALQIDHIRGDGAIERRALKDDKQYPTTFIYKYIIAEPDKAKERYQLLCANCNVIKAVRNREYNQQRSREINKEILTARQLWGYTPRELEVLRGKERRDQHRAEARRTIKVINRRARKQLYKNKIHQQLANYMNEELDRECDVAIVKDE